MERNEELQKWKEKREALKAEERKNSKKRPPFVVGKFTLGEDTIKPNPVKQQKAKTARISTKTATTAASRHQQKTSGPRKVTKKGLQSSAKDVSGTNTTHSSQPLKDKSITNNTASGVGYSTAWLPDAALSTPKATASFEEVFPKAFSPFKFVGTTVDPIDTSEERFTFRKTMEEMPSTCLGLVEGKCEEEMDTSCLEERVTRSDDSVEIINHSILHNHVMSNIINDQKETQSGQGVVLQQGSSLDEDTSEFASFRQLYVDVVDKFTKLCEEWERKLTVLQESGQANDEGSFISCYLISDLLRHS